MQLFVTNNTAMAALLQRQCHCKPPCLFLNHSVLSMSLEHRFDEECVKEHIIPFQRHEISDQSQRHRCHLPLSTHKHLPLAKDEPCQHKQQQQQRLLRDCLDHDGQLNHDQRTLHHKQQQNHYQHQHLKREHLPWDQRGPQHLLQKQMQNGNLQYDQREPQQQHQYQQQSQAVQQHHHHQQAVRQQHISHHVQRGHRVMSNLSSCEDNPADYIPRPKLRSINGWRWSIKNIPLFSSKFNKSSVPSIILFILFALVAGVRCQQAVEHFENVTETIENLLKGYDIRLRPSFGGDPLEIGIEVILASFDSISEVDMDYTITMYLNQYWRDERLQFIFNDTEINNNTIQAMTLTGAFAEKIWVPDTFLANDKNSFLHDITEKNKMVRLHGDGSLVYGMRFTTTLACMMDLHNYPLDHQECTVEIESYGYTMDDIVLYWLNDRNAVTGVEDVSLPQFSISNYDTLNKIEELLTGDYQRLSLIFQLQRNIGYFIFQTYLPSILIVMLSWVSFWINHEATSARVALGITTVLTMTTISNGVRSSLPRISYVKAIDIYLVMCFVFVFAALLEYAAVNYTYWGARAKRKAKRLRERATSVRRRVEEPPQEPMNHSSLEAMELKEIQHHQQMMPPPTIGITNSQSFNLEQDEGPIEIGFRMAPSLPRAHTYGHSHHNIPGGHHGYIPGTAVRRRSSSHVPPRRRRLLSHFRQKAKSIKVKIPRVQDVNTIDKYARLLFPLLFILFNTSYWAVYLLT